MPPKTRPETLSPDVVTCQTNNVSDLTGGPLPNVIEHLLFSQTPLPGESHPGICRQHAYEQDRRYAEVALQKISAGAKVPAHDHCGVELTVVLRGSFSDSDGLYQEGDFLLKSPGEVHQPHACSHEDCLCLTVQNAPIRMTEVSSFIQSIFEPFELWLVATHSYITYLI